MRTLEGTLRWFQDRVAGPHEGRALPRLDASSVLLPSRTLTADERIGIYSGMYAARLEEALLQDYPVVEAFLGHPRFHALCRRYIAKHPSRHFSLNPLGRHLPQCLTGPARSIALVERAMSEAFDAEEVESAQAEAFSGVRPQQVARLRLSTIPAFRLLSLDHRVNPFIDAAKQGRPLPSVPRRRSWMAVYRKGYVVWRMDLDGAAFAALEEISRGRTVGRALVVAARRWIGSPQALEEAIRRWFGEWAREGFFAAARSRRYPVPLRKSGARLESP